MSPSLEDPALLALYGPYCGGITREELLRRALVQLGRGELEGVRPLRDASAHRFRLQWQVVLAPLDSCACELRFPAEPAVHYSFSIASHQLVGWLMEALEQPGDPALPESFWQWLLRGEGS